MLMKELKEQKCISHRTYRYLNVAFRHIDEECEKFDRAQEMGKKLPDGEKGKFVTELFNDQDERFAKSSLEEILHKLSITEPEDISSIWRLGAKSVEEIRAVWPL